VEWPPLPNSIPEFSVGGDIDEKEKKKIQYADVKRVTSLKASTELKSVKMVTEWGGEMVD